MHLDNLSNHGWTNCADVICTIMIHIVISYCHLGLQCGPYLIGATALPQFLSAT